MQVSSLRANLIFKSSFKYLSQDLQNVLDWSEKNVKLNASKSQVYSLSLKKYSNLHHTSSYNTESFMQLKTNVSSIDIFFDYYYVQMNLQQQYWPKVLQLDK